MGAVGELGVNAPARQVTRLPRGSARPLYQQVIDRISALVRDGRWRTGEKIPSENELVLELGVSRMTVNRALQELKNAGMLTRVQGVGTFIAPPVRHGALVEIRDIAGEIRAEGAVHTARVVRARERSADARISVFMECARGTRVYHVRIVHSRNTIPVQLENRLVSLDLVPGFPDNDFTQVTPSEYLVGIIPAEEIEHTVRAVAPDAHAARLLTIERVEPCLQLVRRTWYRGRVVSRVTFLYPGNRYDLSARYRTRGTRPLTILPEGYSPAQRHEE